jgi:hypothetical protein
VATRKKLVKAPKRVEVPRRSAREITEDDVKAATHILTMDYYNDCRSVAQDLAQRMKDGEVDDFSQSLNEAIDSTQRITYTFQAKLGLILSDNGDAYVDDFGTEGIVEGGNIMWERMAFVAMERDVIKELEVRDVDVNNPRSWSDIDMSEFR